MRHKHADVIHAWAEGAEVEYLAGDGSWIPCDHNPQWWTANEYRVKPSFEIIKYRNYITEEGRIGVVVEGEPPPDDMSMWLDDWLEVEVEV